MPVAFYELQDDGSFLATELTRGPWDPDSQHAGPPAALIGREIERLGGGRVGGPDGEPSRLGRVTYEVLRPVPIARLRVSAQVVRPGRRVEMVEATLTQAEGGGGREPGDGVQGEPLIRARAWRLRTEPVGFEQAAGASEVPPPGPEAGEPGEFFLTGEDVGYHTAMEYRFISGAFMEAGPAVVWMRPRVPLVAGEELTPLARVLIAADSGNGVSSALDWRRYLFINVDLSVHLHRLPQGEWVCLDAVTLPEPDGIGIADTVLLDQRGRIGRAVQTLLVADRQAR